MATMNITLVMNLPSLWFSFASAVGQELPVAAPLYGWHLLAKKQTSCRVHKHTHDGMNTEPEFVVPATSLPGLLRWDGCCYA